MRGALQSKKTKTPKLNIIVVSSISIKGEYNGNINFLGPEMKMLKIYLMSILQSSQMQRKK